MVTGVVAGISVEHSGPRFNKNRYGKSHCGDKTAVRSSYLHNGISYTGKMTSLYWIRAQIRIDINEASPLGWRSDH